MMTMKYMIANINPSGIRKLEKPDAGLAWKNVAKIMVICATDPFFYSRLPALLWPGKRHPAYLKKTQKNCPGASSPLPSPPLSWILAAAMRLPAVIFGAGIKRSQ
jgi:hypothetical protein